MSEPIGLHDVSITVEDLDGMFRKYIMKLSSVSGVPTRYFGDGGNTNKVASIMGRAVWITKMNDTQKFYWLSMTLRMMTPRQVIEYMYPQARQFRKN